MELILETKASAKPDEGLTKARKLVEHDRVHLLGGVIASPVAYAIASFPNTTQFWKWSPEAFMAMTPYAELRGKWVR